MSVAFTWFTFVFGGGAATGAQAYSLFAVHGWTALWMPLVAIAIVAVVGWLCVDYANKIGAHHYREVIETLYRSKLVGTIYEIGCIYGTVLGLATCFASLGSLTVSLGFNYWLGILVMAAACTACSARLPSEQYPRCSVLSSVLSSCLYSLSTSA